jgi:hypothetical protein
VKGAEMSQDATQRPAVIFMSYRRGDTQWAARGIYDRLVTSYGRGNVFRDLDAIPPGARFRDYVEKKISESDVFILLIGNAWASYQDDAGRRRLEQPRDPVRMEVETALRLEVPIIPVRVEGAPMPTERDLVPSIYDLLEFNAAEVSDSRWDYDLDRLLRAINETVERWRARREADEQARREADEQARREADEQARREADEQARRESEEQARREAEEQARRESEEQARRESEERARREVEEQARRKREERARREIEARARRDRADEERRVHPHPKVEPEPTLPIKLSLTESVEQTPIRSWQAARHLLRRRAVIIVTTVGIVGVLIAFFMSGRPAIMDHLPDNLRAGCTASTDDAANCKLADGTVVFFRLFDTAAEAEADVTNGAANVLAGQPCPPSAPSANTSVVCRYAVGSQKGTAMFGYTAKDDRRFFVSRWVPETEPLLRGEMSTETAEPLDWTTLVEDWTALAGKG